VHPQVLARKLLKGRGVGAGWSVGGHVSPLFAFVYNPSSMGCNSSIA
jgi:hypothetical protein